MKRFLMAGAMALIGAVPGLADEPVRVATDKTVAQAVDALEAAVQSAGATVFARVDHAAGAESVGMDLAPMQLLIFGNPKLGTPAIQADPVAGLHLPLQVLVYEDGDGAVWLVYEDPAEMLDGLAGDDAVIAKMQGALQKLTRAAAD